MKIPKDMSKVNVNDPGEFLWWSAHLGIGLEKLMSIVNKVGPKPGDIRNQFMQERENGKPPARNE